MSRKRTPQSNNRLPIILVGVGLAMVVGAIAWIMRPAPTPEAAPPSQHSEEDTFPEIARVSLEEAKAAFEDGTAVFVDVRDASAYAESHVPGALSIPMAELDERQGELERSDWIILYCT